MKFDTEFNVGDNIFALIRSDEAIESCEKCNHAIKYKDVYTLTEDKIDNISINTFNQNDYELCYGLSGNSYITTQIPKNNEWHENAFRTKEDAEQYIKDNKVLMKL